MKNEKGITLIALIITIIVMLILVGVTINIALNGGLFEKAKTASENTQKEADREQLISAVIGTLNDDGTVNEEELKANLPEEFEYVSLKNVYRNKVTGKEYTVNLETGNVTESTNSNAGDIHQGEGTYSFTVGDVVQYGDYDDGDFIISGSDLFSNEAIEALKDSITPLGQGAYYFNNVVCTNSSLINLSTSGYSEEIQGYYILQCSDNLEMVMFRLGINGTTISKTNYEDYADLTFTITK